MHQSLRLHLHLNQVFYAPGDEVICTVQVYNDVLGEPVLLKELGFHSAGQERTDPSWVTNLSRPEHKPEVAEPRKQIRSIYRTEPTILLTDTSLQPGTARQYHVRFRLPADAPPTFKGSSVRFSYSVDVKALYELHPRSGQPSALHETTASSVLQVWPPALQLVPQDPVTQLQSSAPAMQAAAHLHRLSHGNGSSGGGAGELGPGTAAAAAAGQTCRSVLSTAGWEGGSSSQVLGPDRLLLPGPSASVGGTLHQHSGIQQPEPAPAPVLQQDPPLLDYQLQQAVRVRVRVAAPDPVPPPQPQSASVSLMKGAYSPARTASRLASGPGTAAMSTPNGSATHLLDLSGGGRTAAAGLGPGSGVPAPCLPASPGPNGRPHSDSLSALAAHRLQSLLPAMASPQHSHQHPHLHHRLHSPHFTPSRQDGRRHTPTAGWSDSDVDSDTEAARPAGSSCRRSQQFTSSQHQGQGQHSRPGSPPARSTSHQHRALQPQTSFPSYAGSKAGGAGGGAGGVNPALSRSLAGRAGGAPSCKSFLLNSGDQAVLRITLQAPLDTPLQPGATFGGLLDLRPQPGPPVGPQAAGPGPGLPAAPAAGQLLCHQLVILLETEEVISPAHRTRSRGTTGGVIRKLHGEHQEMTTGLSMTHFLFSVPLLATPSFRTPMVSLRWVLRFELSVGKAVDGSDSWTRVDPAAFQQLSWALPVIVQSPRGQAL